MSTKTEESEDQSLHGWQTRFDQLTQLQSNQQSILQAMIEMSDQVKETMKQTEGERLTRELEMLATQVTSVEQVQHQLLDAVEEVLPESQTAQREPTSLRFTSRSHNERGEGQPMQYREKYLLAETKLEMIRTKIRQLNGEAPVELPISQDAPPRLSRLEKEAVLGKLHQRQRLMQQHLRRHSNV